MMQQPTEHQFLNLSPIQLWSLNTQFGLIAQQNPSFAYVNTTTTPIFDTKITRMAELGAIVARVDERQVELYQELEKVMTSPAERPPSQEIILTGGFRTGRPFKKPTFPIKIIWCKTVICLMDMECDLPERLDFNVSALHGLPRYLSTKEDYFYNEAPEAAHNRWRVYSALRNYVTREVEEMVEFICAIDGCNHFFPTRDQVVDHIFASHKLFPPSVFKCNWAECERQDHFGAFYQIETHIQRHKVERPFICQANSLQFYRKNYFQIPECGKSYRRLENLRTHMRSHNGEKPYKCKYDFCDRCFTNASDRAKHENRTHSSVKGFSCLFDECVKLYTDPSSLRKHIINNHGQETYNMHKQLKAEERKRKVEQRMIDRHINRSLNQSTQAGPMRKNVRQKAAATSLSQSPSSSRSSNSAFSNNSPQISPVPVLETIQPIFATPFSMSRILGGDILRPILPPTTSMVQLPIRPTPIITTAVTRTEIPMPILPQLVPLLNFPLPQNLNDNNAVNNQLLASFLLARMQIMSLNSQL